ncbi:hypothetical protein MMPV_004349 [Pyropia vietnamensis]
MRWRLLGPPLAAAAAAAARVAAVALLTLPLPPPLTRAATAVAATTTALGRHRHRRRRRRGRLRLALHAAGGGGAPHSSPTEVTSAAASPPERMVLSAWLTAALILHTVSGVTAVTAPAVHRALCVWGMLARALLTAAPPRLPCRWRRRRPRVHGDNDGSGDGGGHGEDDGGRGGRRKRSRSARTAAAVAAAADAAGGGVRAVAAWVGVWGGGGGVSPEWAAALVTLAGVYRDKDGGSVQEPRHRGSSSAGDGHSGGGGGGGNDGGSRHERLVAADAAHGRVLAAVAGWALVTWGGGGHEGPPLPPLVDAAAGVSMPPVREEAMAATVSMLGRPRWGRGAVSKGGVAPPPLVPAVDVDGVLAAMATITATAAQPQPPLSRRWWRSGFSSAARPPPSVGPSSRAAYIEALSTAVGEALLIHGVAVPPSALAIVPATGSLHLATPAAARWVPPSLRRRLAMYYLAAATGYAPATAQAFGATGISLRDRTGRLGDQVFDAIGVVAAATLDTRELPEGGLTAAARVLWGRVVTVSPSLVGVVATVGELRGLRGRGRAGEGGRPFGVLVRRSALRGVREGGWE